MNNNLNKFQIYFRQNPILISIFILLQIIFIILLIFIIKNININTFEESNLPVSNLKQDLQDLPENSVETIQTALYNIVAANHGTLDSIENSDAQVREGTLVNLYFEKQNMHYINFIVDIPSIRQSYQIFNEWSDNPTNKYYMTNMVTMAMCPLASQIEYSDFKCHDKYNHNGQSIIVSQFLPYLDSENYSTFTRYDKAPYIIIIAPAIFNVDDSTKASYIQQTKEKIISLGFPSDTFSYYVSYGPEDSDAYLDYIISNQ